MLIFSFSILILAFIAIVTNLDYKNNALTLFAGGLILFLLAILRHESMGADTASYINNFLSLKSETSSTEDFELGFYYFKRFISSFTESPSVYLMVNSFIFLSSIFIFLYRYSKEAFLSIIIFISLGYYQFSFSGLRQSIAIAILLFSYKFIIEKKLLYFFIIVMVAAQFHNSALIFLAAYPIAHLKINLWHYVYLFSLLALISFFGYFILDNLISLLKMDFLSGRFRAYYGNLSTVSLSAFYILLSIWSFCYVIYKKYDRNDQLTILLNIVFIGLLFQSLTPLLAEFFRLSMYFNIFTLALVPNSILMIRSSFNRGLVYVIILILFILNYVLFGIDNYGPYKFYWE